MGKYLLTCMGCALMFCIFLLPVQPQELHAGNDELGYPVDRVEHARSESLWSARMYELYTHRDYEQYPPFSQALNFTDIDYPLLHAALFYESNRARVSEGLDALPWNINLEITAYNHSLFMVESYEFAHYSGDSRRRSPNNRGSLAGITNPQVTENIAINFALDYEEGRKFYVHDVDLYSYDNNPANSLKPLTYIGFAKNAVNLWMESFGHRKNLLSPNAVEMGAGAFFYREANSGYFPKFRTTQNFQWWTPVIPGESRDPLPPGFRLE